MVIILPGATRVVGCSEICEKSTRREEMKATSNMSRLVLIIFSGSAGGKKLQKSGGQEVFARGDGSRKMVAFLEARRLG